MSRFDWAALMRAGMVGRGLRPAELWALTPAELQLMLGRDGGVAPLGREELAALAARFPDVKGEEDDGT